MKILICGSRNIELKNKKFIFETLENIVSKEQYFTDKNIPNTSLEIVSGNNQKGADYIGELWAKENKLKLKLFPAAADWTNKKPKKPNQKGADYIGELWAKENKLKLKLFPADWTNKKPKKPENWGSSPTCIWKPDYYDGYNSLAGYVRNQEMANYATGEICIAFDAEEKRGNTGTRDMIKRAKKAWMKVYHVKCHDLNNVEIKVYNEGLQK